MNELAALLERSDIIIDALLDDLWETMREVAA